MLIHWIWLSLLPEVPVRQKLRLLEAFGSPEDLFNAGSEAVRKTEGLTEQTAKALEEKDLTEARKVLDDCGKKRISILSYGDGAYPSRLRNVEEPPLVLYYKGCLPDWESVPVIGVVGTRNASAYGIQSAGRLSQQIAGCGALVVSGGAAGIDAAAMEGALAAGSGTVAVLGCGVDIVYPKKNKGLFLRTAERGCIISEYVPGTRPYKWNFPRRNRIISGLSNGILVVEAPEKSGALITVRYAWDQGRDVFVVPGNINVDSCAGSNALLKEQAMPVFSGWDVVREYELLYPGRLHRCDTVKEPEARELAGEENLQREKNDKLSIDKKAQNRYSDLNTELPELTQEEQRVFELLSYEPRPVDEVIAEAGLPAGKVLSVLTKLSLKGVAANHPGKCVSKK